MIEHGREVEEELIPRMREGWETEALAGPGLVIEREGAPGLVPARTMLELPGEGPAREVCVRPRLLVLAGPPGAGKSTTALRWASEAEGTWAWVSQDYLRTLVKAGYANASEPWGPEHRAQWTVSIQICCDMARRYLAAGINCVIDAFVPADDLPRWMPALEELNPTLVVLMPDLDTALGRNAQRSGIGLLAEAEIRASHARFQGYREISGEPTPGNAILIDNAALSVDEVLGRLRQILPSRMG